MEITTEKRKHLFYMDLAKDVALYSFLGNYKVTKGAILVNKNYDDYQGTIQGEFRGARAKMLCDGLSNMEWFDNYEIKKQFVCHAESRVIINILNTGGNVRDNILYCTHHPCQNCAKLIIQSGIKQIYYGKLNDTDNFLHFKDFGVNIEQIE